MKKSITSIVIALCLFSCAKKVEEVPSPMPEPKESTETVINDVDKVFVKELFRSIFGGSR
jgi:hypothetical protein